MNKQNEFIRFLGNLVFETEDYDWDSLTAEQQNEYCCFAKKSETQNLFIYFIQDSLPETFYRKYLEDFRMESFNRLAEKHYLNELYRLLESERIPFIPIKGADLAYRIYPEQALRSHTDWDIMFHKEDCPRVIELLRKQNWTTYSGYNPGDPGTHHHYEQLHNEYQSLEIHWTLPHFGNACPEEIWENTEKSMNFITFSQGK